MARSDDHEIDRTITNNLTQLSKYGVLTARPGYEITDHQLNGRRAIDATVHTEKPKAGLDQDEALPDNIGGVPVGVRDANSYPRLRAIDPLAAKITQTYRRPEEAEPEWPFEREIPNGELVTKASRLQRKQRRRAKSLERSDHLTLSNATLGPRKGCRSCASVDRLRRSSLLRPV
jgi:hypothetical protein